MEDDNSVHSSTSTEQDYCVPLPWGLGLNIFSDVSCLSENKLSPRGRQDDARKRNKWGRNGGGRRRHAGANTSVFLVVFFQMTKLKGTSPDEVALGQ